MGKKSNGFVKAPLLGKLAIKNSLVTEQEFNEALNACSGATDPEEALKKYFLTHELISPQNLKRLTTATKAIELRQKDIKFGTIAINKGLISQSVLDLALEEQNHSFKTDKNPRLIGDILVTAGIITVGHRNLILKTQNRLIKEIKQDYTSDSSNENSGTHKSEDNNHVPETQKQKTLFNASTTEIVEHGIKLEITQDDLVALITKTDDFDDNINPKDIKDLLNQRGITFGVVNNDLILGFIKSIGFRKKGFVIAKGTKPVEGKDAKIECFFDTDYLKAGGLSTSGKIDFKDRGIIPQVEQGTVLSEKIPLKASFNGRSIFDKELITNEAQDIKLRCGKGTKLSEDRLKILAAVNGHPKLTWAGLVVVNQEYTTTGDVNYKTGHIKYDGNIAINGCIKDGFEVRGNDISALEIQGGIIHAEGNLNIINGVNEATIYAKGNVYSKFIHNSKIVCMGDVCIAKEIVDSEIETSGACNARDGKIISCKITAKMGVSAKQLGTELSEPSIIKTGHDVFVIQELSTIRIKIKDLIKEKNKVQKNKEELISKNKEYHENATHFANLQEKSRTNLKNINAKLNSAIKNKSEKNKTVDLKNKLDSLLSKDNKINIKLESSFDKIDAMETTMTDVDNSLFDIQQSIDDLTNEKKNLSEWSAVNQGNTTVKTTGIIFPGTIIQGLHSEKQIENKVINTKIKELGYKSDDGKKGNHLYQIVIT